MRSIQNCIMLETPNSASLESCLELLTNIFERSLSETYICTQSGIELMRRDAVLGEHDYQIVDRINRLNLSFSDSSTYPVRTRTGEKSSWALVEDCLRNLEIQMPNNASQTEVKKHTRIEKESSGFRYLLQKCLKGLTRIVS